MKLEVEVLRLGLVIKVSTWVRMDSFFYFIMVGAILL